MSETKSTEIIKPRTLAGFRDALPETALLKENMISSMITVFRGYGFMPIETPHLELTEILLGNSSDEIRKQLYRFNDNGERDVTLRFDLTVPFARYVVQHKNDLGLPFKRYAVGNVFRGESPQAGRYREFTQCDFDCVGSDSVSSDAEIILIIHDALHAIGLPEFKIKINNRKILDGIIRYWNAEDKANDLLRIIDKLDKIGQVRVAEHLKEIGLNDEAIAGIIEFTQLKQKDAPSEFLKSVEKYKDKHELIKEGLDEMGELLNHLTASKVSESKFGFDFSIARGLGYYTGIIYETFLDAFPKIGSICSGGRYDNLTKTFSKQSAPGVGASFGIDRIMAVLGDSADTKQDSPVKILIACLSRDVSHKAQGLAYALRQKGVAAELYPTSVKIAKQFSYADKKGIPFLIGYGETELESDQYIVADLKSGEKKTVNGLAGILELVVN